MDLFNEKLKERDNSINMEKKEKPLMSICIPTYNRGKVLYERMLKYIDVVIKYPIEIVVSNNGSTLWCDYYEKIAEFADKYDNFIYHENESNLGYSRNIKKLFEICNGTYALFMSDEDYLDKDLFPTLMEHVAEASENDVGFLLVKCSFHDALPHHVYTYGIDDYYPQIKVNMMMGYLTGMCFRRSVIIDNGFIDNIDKLIENNFWVDAYIHCYMAARISCRKLCIYLCDSDYIIKGKDEEDRNTSESEEIGRIYTLQGRADEFEGVLLYLCNEEAIDVKTIDKLIKSWILYIFKLVTLAYDSFKTYYDKRYSSVYEALNEEAALITAILQKYDILNNEYKEIIDSFRHE